MAEDELLESQCGFRKKWSYKDVTYLAHLKKEGFPVPGLVQYRV